MHENWPSLPCFVPLFAPDAHGESMGARLGVLVSVARVSPTQPMGLSSISCVVQLRCCLEPYRQIGLDGVIMALAGKLAIIANTKRGGLADAKIQSRLDESSVLSHRQTINREGIAA